MNVNETESRRWDLIYKEVYSKLSKEEMKELAQLQEEVFKRTKLLNKCKPSSISVGAESYESLLDQNRRRSLI